MEGESNRVSRFEEFVNESKDEESEFEYYDEEEEKEPPPEIPNTSPETQQVQSPNTNQIVGEGSSNTDQLKSMSSDPPKLMSNPGSTYFKAIENQWSKPVINQTPQPSA